jgi:hypothetical protein
MARTRKAEIKWSYPIKVDSALKNERCIESWGIYYISRKFGSSETLLYIGLTFHQNFIHRIIQHHNVWMNDYRGEKYIRFGEFDEPKIITKEIIENVESCLIYELQPVQNVSKKSSYSCYNEYTVISSGFRGIIPREISTKNH